MADFPMSARRTPRLEVVPHTGSTNADLRGHAADAEAWPHLSVLVTRDQRAGRGRLDRSWTAPPGASLAISVLLRARLDPALRGWIPLIAGLAMADAVAGQLPGLDVGVKWPNDVLVAERKICGILAEATGEAVIVGAGVNTAMTAQQLPVASATSFAVLGAPVDEDRLLAAYLDGLDGRLDALATAGDPIASGLHADAVRRSATLGRPVEVSLPGGRSLTGTARGLDTDGRLLIDAEGRTHVVSAGDVIHARRV